MHEQTDLVDILRYSDFCFIHTLEQWIDTAESPAFKVAPCSLVAGPAQRFSKQMNDLTSAFWLFFV